MGLHIVFNTLFQIWSKCQYLQHMPLARTYWQTGWLTTRKNWWMSDWMNKCLSNALLICHRKWGKVFFKISRLQSPNQGSHMMEFLLISPVSVYMIPIRALKGRQLINLCNLAESTFYQWFSIFSHDPLTFPRSELIDEVLRNHQLGQQFELEYHLILVSLTSMYFAGFLDRVTCNRIA